MPRIQKLKYRLERWRYHICKDKIYFTNKKQAKKWLKESFWWDEFNDGGNMIYIYVDNKLLDWEQVNKEWRFDKIW